MKDYYYELLQRLDDVSKFAETSSIRLRSYQKDVANAVVDSVIHHRGLSFVVIFPRQSGKNELQSQIEAYLLMFFHQVYAEMIKVSPTFKPQTLNAMRRLENTLSRNIITNKIWAKESGYIFRIFTARMSFFSGAPTANVVGATATHLLECDEAQDVQIAKWDKEIAPMAASTNATRVFWGTAWTSQTLLAREQRAALELEQQDGIQRLFTITADQVREEVPAYGRFVDGEIARHGRNHPFIRSQYFCETIDAEGGMFPPARRALMLGAHPPAGGPIPGEQYAFLLDFAGEDEAVTDIEGDSLLSNPGRDSTALTIVRLDLSLLDALKYPRYQVVYRRQWTGVKHTQLFGQLVALAENWGPRCIVCDSTGVGAGVTSFLTKTFGEGRVISYNFTSGTKSKLGWDFLSVIENGRFQDYHPHSQEFFTQLEHCTFEIIPGPGRVMRWSVPDGTRDIKTGELIHDDLIISAALCSVLDDQTWGLAISEVIPGYDPISSLGDVF